MRTTLPAALALVVASVFDPFGNVVGIIENPHFKHSPE